MPPRTTRTTKPRGNYKKKKQFPQIKPTYKYILSNRRGKRDGLIPVTAITNIRKKRAHDKETRVARVQVRRRDYNQYIIIEWSHLDKNMIIVILRREEKTAESSATARKTLDSARQTERRRRTRRT